MEIAVGPYFKGIYLPGKDPFESFQNFLPHGQHFFCFLPHIFRQLFQCFFSRSKLLRTKDFREEKSDRW